MDQINRPNSTLGFYSPDGYFQPIAALSTANLEFVSKTLYDLEQMLDHNIHLEHYEKCALIRDEIIRRAVAKKSRQAESN
ncbi:hypothetical protein [Mucilaginibacter sp. CSA2-8R]|uniref:hypothetical protein n=1 Tax=Mucilaginibacter sp. CSA2-8R TaxID=3141542 RepID=UPI00315C4C7E